MVCWALVKKSLGLTLGKKNHKTVSNFFLGTFLLQDQPWQLLLLLFIIIILM